MTSPVTDEPEPTAADGHPVRAEGPAGTKAPAREPGRTTKNPTVDESPAVARKAKPAANSPRAVTAPPSTTQKAKRRLGYRRQRFEARKVRRLVRHVDPWSVLKLAVLLALCLWVILVIASVIIWSVANNTGALESVENFINQNLQLEDWTFEGDVLFRQFALLSLLGCLGFAAMTVVASLIFNLISDIIGGVWISVIEEESARPVMEPRSPEQGSTH